MKELKKISVAMCTYNGSKYIKEQIDSILNQTVIPDEIIICDDNSTDSTVEICNKIAEKSLHCKIRIFVNENNVGYIKNFEQSISYCEGDIIFLSDQDDVWRKDKVELVRDVFLNNQDVGVVISDSLLVDGNLNSFGETVFQHMNINTDIVKDSRELFKIVSKQNFASGSAIAINKNFSRKVMPFPSTYVHDQWIMIVASLSSKVYCLNDPLVYYRQHGNNALGIKQKNEAPSIFKMVRNSFTNDDVEKKYNQLNFLIPYIQNKFRIDELNIDYAELVQCQKYYELRTNINKGTFSCKVRSLFKLKHSGLYNVYGNGNKTFLKDMIFLFKFGNRL